MKHILLVFVISFTFDAILCKVRIKKQFLDYGSLQNDDFNENGEINGAENENFLNGNNFFDAPQENDYGEVGELGASRDLGSMEGGEGVSDISSLFNQPSSSQTSQNSELGLPDASSDFSNSLPSFNGIIGSSNDNEFSNSNNNDLLSSFSDDPFGKKLESSVNLDDSMDTAGGFDQAELTGSSSSETNKNPPSLGSIQKLLSNAKYASSSHHKQSGNKHDNGDGREGIGNRIEDMQDLLQNELGQLDTADEKLQKMLESGIDSDSSNFAEGNVDTSNGMAPSMEMAGSQSAEMPSSDNGLLNSLQNQMNQLENQYPSQPGNNYQSPDFSSTSDELLEQQNALNQMSGTMQQNSMEGIQPVTIHAHASDKSSKQSQQQASPEASQKLAAQVQQDAKKNHEQKLLKLKKRLGLLRQKLAQLEEEQAKKSTSNTNKESPKTSRNNAIKKLLIKNLKLAEMIASKELQLEEAKGRALDYMSGKKEDNLKDVDDDLEEKHRSRNSGESSSKRNSSLPITELSRKAEEEVNHLTRNQQSDSNEKLIKHSNKTLTNSSNNNVIEITEASLKSLKENNKIDTISKINETLQILDKSGESSSFKNDSSNLLANSSRRFLQTLKKKVDTMTPLLAHSVQEKALASLYKAIKIKAAETAKKRNQFFDSYIHHNTNSNNVSMSTFS